MTDNRKQFLVASKTAVNHTLPNPILQPCLSFALPESVNPQPLGVQGVP